ncbi:hypothetical protein FBQ73_16850 [Xanthobacter autotrophicus]|uniref:Uncharacterized protein n=1 Tax=Xanthobacter autotrophicus TaxID=280 RepID=A0A6C1KEX1_XANAU|nr:hypothetical protein FBQ73_16850 [Xanthobacter autotrophicus]
MPPGAARRASSGRRACLPACSRRTTGAAHGPKGPAVRRCRDGEAFACRWPLSDAASSWGYRGGLQGVPFAWRFFWTDAGGFHI